VYGNRVIVETDHKPLVGLVDNSIDLCTPKIQRMRLHLQTYSYYSSSMSTGKNCTC
jgi:hypothetical protein